MDIAQINASSSLVTSLSAESQASVYALKKAMQLQEQSALQLINNLPQPVKTTDPNATLGRNIDIKA